MNVLLDEGVPKILARLLADRGIDASAFPNHWKGMTNGALLDAAQEAGFTAIVTNDKNVIHQQPIAGRRIALVVLPSNRRIVVVDRADDIAAALKEASPGAAVVMPPAPAPTPPAPP